MSVLMIDPKVYDLVYVKLVDFTYHKECNIKYCSVFGRMSEEKIKEFVKTLCILNEQSYCDKYKDTFSDLSSFIKFRFSGETINTYQVLKYLICIRYNIEIDTIVRDLTENEKECMIILNKGIDEIQLTIISLLPEYEKCKWSDPVEIKTHEVISLSSRSNRSQLRLDKAAKTHARNIKRGNTVRYY